MSLAALTVDMMSEFLRNSRHEMEKVAICWCHENIHRVNGVILLSAVAIDLRNRNIQVGHDVFHRADLTEELSCRFVRKIIAFVSRIWPGRSRFSMKVSTNTFSYGGWRSLLFHVAEGLEL